MKHQVFELGTAILIETHIKTYVKAFSLVERGRNRPKLGKEAAGVCGGTGQAMERVAKKVCKLSHRAESGGRFALRSLYVIGPESFLPTVLNPITFRYRQRGPRNIG